MRAFLCLFGIAAIFQNGLSLPSSGISMSKNPGGVVHDELALPKEAIGALDVGYYMDPKTGEIIAEGVDEGTRCLIECINEIERVELDLPGTDQMKDEFGKWMDTPYRTFVFQTVCGSYAQRKSCLDQCPDSEAKRMTHAAMGPLDFICVDHYQDFLENMGCLLSAKKKIAKTCHSQCGSMNDVIFTIQELQNMDGEPVDKTNQALGYLCQFADCRQECFRPILKESCGDKASKLIDRFSSSSSRAFLKELDALGAVGVSPEACIDLKMKEKALVEFEKAQDAEDSMKEEMVDEFRQILNEENIELITPPSPVDDYSYYVHAPDSYPPGGYAAPALPIEAPDIEGEVPEPVAQGEYGFYDSDGNWQVYPDSPVNQQPISNGYWGEDGQWVDLSPNYPEYPHLTEDSLSGVNPPPPVQTVPTEPSYQAVDFESVPEDENYSNNVEDYDFPNTPDLAKKETNDYDMQEIIDRNGALNREEMQKMEQSESRMISNILIVMAVLGGVIVGMIVILMGVRRARNQKGITLAGSKHPTKAKINIFQNYSTPQPSPKKHGSTLPY